MKKPISRAKTPILPFVLITSLFLLWGLANNMTDTLLAAFKKIMSMTDFQTSWIQIAFYGSYFCLALPAAILIKKYSYKTGILWGLGLFIAGSLLFYPASITQNYTHFLIALFILAGGLSILETTANPYIIAIGPEETGTRRLNFAQSFNPIGSLIGVLLSKIFILSELNAASSSERNGMSAEQLNALQSEELSAVMGPYVGVAFLLIIIWIMVASVNMPKASEAGTDLQLKATFSRLIKNKKYVGGVIAQFFYVGAQIGVWSYTIRYAMKELAINEEQASSYYLYSLILFIIFRFISTWLMKFFKPGALLTVASFLAVVSTAVVVFGHGYAGVFALVTVSGCMSLMFPTIYGLSTVGLGNDIKIAGSGLIMAILGGAVITAIQGQVSDISGSINYSYLVPLACFVIVAIYGISSRVSKNISS